VSKNPEQNGRGLEFAFARAFLDCFTNGALYDGGRLGSLQGKFDACAPAHQARFRRAALAYFAMHGVSPELPSEQSDATLTLFTDEEAQHFGVRDFSLVIGPTSQDVSLKHNHFALKHPRIPSLMQSLGVMKGLDEDLRYRVEYDQLLQSIWVELKDAGVALDSFASLGDKKFTVLYPRVMQFMAETINRFGANSQSVQHLFRFLTGGDHVKVVVLPKKIQVFDMRLLKRPKKMVAWTDPAFPNYMYIEFESALTVSYRIKNDKKELNLISPSLKPDVQPVSKLPLIHEISF
jgi:hypothetical protein